MKIKLLHISHTSPARLFRKLTFLFICLFSACALSSTDLKEDAFFASPKQSYTGNELILLWETALSSQAVSEKLAFLSDSLLILEHEEDFTVCRTLDATKLGAQLDALSLIDGVLVAEPNYEMELFSVATDPYFRAQWAFENTGTYSYYIEDISILRMSFPDVDLNITEAWEVFPDTSKTVTVAIIDTGVDIYHPDLEGHLWTNPLEIPDNGIDDDGNGYIDDVYGWDFYNNDATVVHYIDREDGSRLFDPTDNDSHGTHCAGIIAATANNDIGIAGVASNINVQILPLKIHGGPKGSGSVSNAVKAVKYATAAGADICNMSWGTTVYSEALELVMKESDMLFIAAAGNNGRNNNSTPMYPAGYQLNNLISVAYIDAFGNLASDSNYGTSTVDIAAPGADIYSLAVGGGYAYASGTSMAAPHVSGIAAMLYACGDSLYPANVKEIILNNLKPLESLTGFLKYPGIPDAEKIIAARDSLVSDTTTPTLKLASTFDKEAMQVRLIAEDLGGSGIRVIKYAAGEQDLSFFARGTFGTTASGSTAEVVKSGLYTFYISDYAGNELVQTCFVEEDTDAPLLSASYVLEKEQNGFLITIHAVDLHSGIKTLRYLEGSHTTDSFLAAGIDLEVKEDSSLFVSNAGVYTIYAADYRGNKAVFTIDVQEIPASDIVLNVTKRALSVGQTFSLVPVLFPFHTTDILHYESSDELVATVSADGLITAHAEGVATITVTASNGVRTTCLFLVKATPQESAQDASA